MLEKYDIIIQDKSMKDIDHKNIYLRQIRSNARKVQIHDLETDEVAIYPSIYRAALVLGQNPGVIVCIMEKYGGIDTLLKY